MKTVRKYPVKFYKRFACVIGILSIFATVSAKDPLPSFIILVKNSTARAVLVIPNLPVPEEKKAANEIQYYVAKISGAIIKIIKEGEDMEGLTPVFIGRAASQGLENIIRKKGIDPYSFALIISSRHISLRGLSPQGTLVAAYELLEKLGVRWFMPGDMGTVIPELQTIALKYGTTIQTPSFPSRYHAGSRRDEWNEHMKMGGLRFPSSHGLQFTREAPFEKRPELYSLVKGQRVNRQHCISNPEVVKLIVAQTKAYFKKNPESSWLGMGPNDDGGYCECNNCLALDGGDFDPLTNYMSMTDRYIWFYNQVLAGIKDEFSTKKIAFYAYAEYVRPPVKQKPDQRIVPAMAPITLCRIHGMNNPVCPERSQYRTWILGWKALVPDVYERGYWWNLSDPGLPFSSVHRIRDEIPAGYKLGLEGWRTETADHWGSETPSLYIAAKLMWDHKADVNALLNDFYSKFFGAAASPMKNYFTLMDSALKNGNYHTGGAYYIHNVYPYKLRDRARSALLQATKLATNELYKKRIAMFRMTFDYLELFIKMQQTAFAFDFQKAKHALDSIMILQENLIAHQPKLINERVGRTYLHRFYTGPVKSGFEKTTGDNQLLKGMTDQWKFIKDPEVKGIEKKYWGKNYDDSRWKNITTKKSWSDQGMRYYRGEAWYRQSIILPKPTANNRVILWFAGADEFAEVWLNGIRLGTSSPNTFVAFEMGPEKPMMEGLAGSGFYPQPFEFDVSSVVVPAKQNIITVRIVNNLVNELGTGGIMGPVMFYEAQRMK